MSTKVTPTVFLLVLLLGWAAALTAAEPAQPTTAQQLAGLEGMCQASAEARAARHAETCLYDRLGGYDKILAITTEIVRLHEVNPQIRRTLEGVDHELLAMHVADFIAAGTGGKAHYTGRDLASSHRHLDLDDADFLSAGGDVATAMKSQGCGQDEIDEILCILVSMKDQVVFK